MGVHTGCDAIESTLRAEITMLREASWKLARKHHEWGHLGSRMATPIEECLIETCVEMVKALATVKEDG